MNRLSKVAISVLAAVFCIGCPGIVVTITPPAVSVNPGQTIAFTAAVTGTSNTGVTWSVAQPSHGFVDQSGVYTAPAATGTYQVVAASAASATRTATATVTVTATPTTSILISPAAPVVQAGGTLTFTATVTGATDTTVTWSVLEANGGTVDLFGAYTAPTTAGTYHLDATSVEDTTKRARATIIVTAAAPKPTISGVVTGGSAGRVYIVINGSNGHGTSIGGTGSFTIRGITDSAGAYTLFAFQDTNGNGALDQNFDPSGTANIAFDGTTSLTGVSIALTTPSAPGVPPAPADDIQLLSDADSIIASPGGIEDLSGDSLVNTIRVYWSTTASPGPSNKAAGAPKDIPVGRGASSLLFLASPDVAPGTPYYFSYSGVNAAGEGPVRSNATPIAMQAASGGSTLTGSLTFSGSLTGPSLAGMFASGSQEVHYVRLAPGPSPLSYSIAGLSNGQWSFIAATDFDVDGIIGPLDPSIGFSGMGPEVIIAGPTMTGPTIDLPLTFGVPSVHSRRDSTAGAGVAYTLSVDLGPNIKAPVRATLVAAPEVPTPTDIGLLIYNQWQYSLFYYPGAMVPSATGTYQLDLLYADGTAGTLSFQPKSVLTNSPTGVSPTGAAGTLTPTFTWNLGSVPSSYRLRLSVYGLSGSMWNIDLSPGETTKTYNSDGNALPLTAATTYSWSIELEDVNGNQAVDTLTFTTP